jgi:hypothetical protein
MARSRLPRDLTVGVAGNRITLLVGLPRVGRSKALGAWAAGRNDILPFDVTDAPGVMLLDHIGFAQVPDLTSRFRAAEAASLDVRFVAAPVDMATAHRIATEFAGSVCRIECDPLQLDDIIAEQAAPTTASGPTADVVAVAGPAPSPAFDPGLVWLRGGLPQSLAFAEDEVSLNWRRQLLDHLLSRDYSTWDVPAASRLPDVLRWLANQNGGELDESGTGPLDKKADFKAAVHVLEHLGLVRRLRNRAFGDVASLSKLSKVYVRDSGLLHSVMGIETLEQLLTHDAKGESWESHALEALIQAADRRGSPQFYRRKSGGGGEDEIDLVLDFKARCGKLIGIEFKVAPHAAVKPGFHSGCDAIGATDRLVVHAGAEPLMGTGIERLDLASAIQRVAGWAALRGR